MIVIKVKNGTPRIEKSLCETCSQATVVKGANLEHVIKCGILDAIMKFAVAECSDYSNRTATSLTQMEKIAWIVESRERGPVGFQQSTRELDIVISPPKQKES
jgi:hypothetical protein